MAGLLNAFRQYARDAMPGGALNPEVTRQGLLDGAAVASMPVPFVGDAVGLLADANRFATDPASRTPLNFGLSALGLLPLVPGMTAMKSMDRKKFYDTYYQHIDLRGRGGSAEENLKNIKESGFKSSFPNAKAVFDWRNPSDIMEKQFVPKGGDVVYLVPKSAVTNSPNGPKIKPGWKPNENEVLRVGDSAADPYDMFMGLLNRK